MFLSDRACNKSNEKKFQTSLKCTHQSVTVTYISNNKTEIKTSSETIRGESIYEV